MHWVTLYDMAQDFRARQDPAPDAVMPKGFVKHLWNAVIWMFKNTCISVFYQLVLITYTCRQKAPSELTSSIMAAGCDTTHGVTSLLSPLSFWRYIKNLAHRVLHPNYWPTKMPREILVGFGVDVDAVAGWWASFCELWNACFRQLLQARLLWWRGFTFRHISRMIRFISRCREWQFYDDYFIRACMLVKLAFYECWSCLGNTTSKLHGSFQVS